MQAKTNHKNIGLIAFVFACALMLFAGITSANAQAPYYGNNGTWNNQNAGYSRVNDREMRKAYDKGYKEGYKQGKNDARSNRGTNNNTIWNNGRNGGNQLQRAYNDGFQRGYREGYDQNRRNNNRRYGNGNIFGFPRH
jgi:hypothetical protein